MSDRRSRNEAGGAALERAGGGRARLPGTARGDHRRRREGLPGEGLPATSFRDIADAVGVDRASLYYYFESKHELFRAATSVAVERNVADAESIAASDQTPAEKITEIVQRLLASYTDRDYPYMFIFLQEDVDGISDDSDDEWAREMNDYNRRYERAVTAVIAEGAERGDFVLPGAPHVLTKTVDRHGELAPALVPGRRAAQRGGHRRRVRVDLPVRRDSP